MKRKVGFIAIMAVYFLQSGGNAVNAVLQTIADAFPDASPVMIRLISTLPNISSLVLGLILGNWIGKKLSYKNVFLFGILMFVIGGMGPAFIHSSLLLILLFRGLFGFSMGCFSFCNAYILSNTEKEEQAKFIGYGAVSANLGAAFLQMCCGSLADIQWTYAFYPYVIGIISLLLVILFFKEDEEAVKEIAAGRKAKEEKKQASSLKGLNVRVWIYLIIQFLLMITAVCVMTGMAAVISQRNLGGATAVAFVLTVCQIGGVLTGVIFGAYTRILKRFAMPVGLLVQAVGILLVFLGSSVTMIAIGAFISGVGTILVVSMNATFSGQAVSKEVIPMVALLLMVIGQLANFLSNYFIAICDRITGHGYVLDVESAYFVSMFIYAFLILGVTFYNLRGKEQI